MTESTAQGFLGTILELVQGVYIFFVDFNSFSIHRIVYFFLFLGAGALLVHGFRKRDPAHALVAILFWFTFIASRNDVLGIRLLPDRFDLVMFIPATLVLFMWMKTLESSRVLATRAVMSLAVVLVALQVSANITPITEKLRVGQIDWEAYARSAGDPVVPEAVLAVVGPETIRAGRYTSPTTTIQGVADSYVAVPTEFFESADAKTAWEIARQSGIGYVFLDSLHYSNYIYFLRRQLNVDETKFLNRRYFTPVYQGFTELSKIQLFSVNETPGAKDLVVPFNRTIVPAAITSTEAMTTVQREFDRNNVKEFVTEFRANEAGLETLTDYVVTKGRTVYQLTNEDQLQGTVEQNLFSNRLIIRRPEIASLSREHVPNVVKGYMSDGFVLGSISKNLHRQIVWRIEQNNFVMYTRFAVDQNKGSRVVIIYMTAKQLQIVTNIFLFVMTVLGIIAYSLFQRRLNASSRTDQNQRQWTSVQ